MTRLVGVRGVLLIGAALCLVAAPVQAKDEPKPNEPKKNEPKKIDPNDLILPLLPKIELPGNDPELQQLEQELRQMQEQILRQLGQMQGLQRGGLLDLPGARPEPRPVEIDRRPKENRLGASIQALTPALVEQLELPKDQGVVLEAVTLDSPAAKAGLKANDILLELDGKAVPSATDEFVKLLDDIKPGTPVNATVMRKGRRETVKGIKLPEAKIEERPPNRPEPNLPVLPNNVQPALPPLNLAPGQPGVSINTIRTATTFITRFRNGAEGITVSGKLKDGKVDADEIVITNGKDTKKFKALNDVPEEMRDQVKKIIEVTQRGTVSAAEGEKR
jgi:membrane-associated protease RseP (regulator of RpoE activity)